MDRIAVLREEPLLREELDDEVVRPWYGWRLEGHAAERGDGVAGQYVRSDVGGRACTMAEAERDADVDRPGLFGRDCESGGYR